MTQVLLEPGLKCSVIPPIVFYDLIIEYINYIKMNIILLFPKYSFCNRKKEEESTKQYTSDHN